MTHIVSFKTKKAFKEAVSRDPRAVYVDDPSIFSPCSGSVEHVVKMMGMFTVTNHPKRSWFACVEEKNGVIKVS